MSSSAEDALANTKAEWMATETGHAHESGRPSQLTLFDRLSDFDTSTLLADIHPSLV